MIAMLSFLGCAAEYDVTVRVIPEEGGDVIGEGTYQAGEKVTLQAEPAEDFTFTNWTIDGQAVSQEKEYSFHEEDTTLEANFRKIEKIISVDLETARELKEITRWEHDSSFKFGPKPDKTDMFLYDNKAFYFHYEGHYPAILSLTVRDIYSGEGSFSEVIHEEFDAGHATGPSFYSYKGALIVKHGGFRGESPFGIIAYNPESLEEIYRQQFDGAGVVSIDGDYFYKSAKTAEKFSPQKYSLATGDLVWESSTIIDAFSFPTFTKEYIVYHVAEELIVLDKETGELVPDIDKDTMPDYNLRDKITIEVSEDLMTFEDDIRFPNEDTVAIIIRDNYILTVNKDTREKEGLWKLPQEFSEEFYVLTVSEERVVVGDLESVFVVLGE